MRNLDTKNLEQIYEAFPGFTRKLKSFEELKPGASSVARNIERAPPTFPWAAKPGVQLNSRQSHLLELQNSMPGSKVPYTTDAYNQLKGQNGIMNTITGRDVGAGPQEQNWINFIQGQSKSNGGFWKFITSAYPNLRATLLQNPSKITMNTRWRLLGEFIQSFPRY